MTRFASRSTAIALLLGAAAFSLAGCASTDAPSWSFPPPVTAAPAPAAPAQAQSGGIMAAQAAAIHPASLSRDASGTTASTSAAATSAARLDLTIVTGDMIGKTEFPAYVPSDFTLPAHSTVVVTITNFDDATPLPKGSEVYASAAGVVGGTFTVTPIDPKDPNGSAGPTQTLSSLNPAKVSHTFTVPGLGINVPIAAHARVSFTITTGDAGTFSWRCMDPCGAGPSGWGSAMAAKSGYMEGTLTVA
ncbi:MAG: cupredoxin domain-containing protein [Candidatus Limnocylindrales bacterium]